MDSRDSVGSGRHSAASSEEAAVVIHVDTGFIIHALVPASQAEARLRRLLEDGQKVSISSIAWAEFLCGPVGPDEIERASNVFREIAPFTAADCETAVALFNRGGRRRRSMGDCMIAAVAPGTGRRLPPRTPETFIDSARD